MEQPRKPQENLLPAPGTKGSRTASGDATPGQDSSGQRDHDANVRSADQRATALAAVASLAATLALAGAAIIIDVGKWPPAVRPSLAWFARHGFGLCLLLAVGFFSIAAFHALKGHGIKPGDKLAQAGDGETSIEKTSNAKHGVLHSSMKSLAWGLVFVFVLTICAFVAGLTA